MPHSPSSEKRETAVAGIGGPAWTSAAILALVAARLIAAAFIEITPDETYYWLWSRFPAASYYDHPPMVAWWIAAGTAIFGESPLGIRALFTLSIIPTSIAIYVTGRLLFDQATGERAALWTNATLLIGIGGLLATPDAPALMFWSLAILAFALVVKTGQGRWWLAVGLCGALGVLSKLTDLFLGLGILLCLIADRRLRHWLANGWTWAGVVLAGLVLVPMILWNAGHEWATLAKQFGRIGIDRFQALEFPEFIVVQFGLLNPLLALFLGLGVAMWFRRKPKGPHRGLGLLLATALPIVAFMAVHAFQEQIQGHWLAPVYPTLALVAAVAAADPPDRRWATLGRLVFPVGAIVTIIGLILATHPGGVVKVRWDVGQIARGWATVAAEAESLRIANGADWIATTRYTVNGEIAYHLRGKAAVVDIAQRQRYGFAAPDPELLAGAALLISRTGDPQAFAPCFAGVVPVGTITRRSGGESLETYSVYRAEGADPGLLDAGCDLGR
jgi:4-amino-4-deoxy-L-arabinose transferase-like glycosyltransferase